MKSKGLSYPKAYFTKDLRSLDEVFRLFEWNHRPVRIPTELKDGVSKVLPIEAPVDWSDTAVEITATKYFRRQGPGRAPIEKSVRQLVRRVVTAIRDSGVRQGFFASRRDAEIWSGDLAVLLLSQRAFFNSPVWFNLGLFESYGVQGATQNYAWDEKSGQIQTQKHSYLRPQVSACFIQSVEDSIESLYRLAKNEAQLFRFGSGSGTNFSKIRSRDEGIENGGTSSGLLSFLEMLDRGAGAIKSGGTTRRAAKMVCLDVDHPEILDFIRWKSREEDKAQALIQAGYGGGLDGEAYRSVSGQNANNSVRVSKAFMNSLSSGKPWPLRARTTGKVVRRVEAPLIWRELAQAAHRCADPGLQFHDEINLWHTCKDSGPINGSNPCSEYMFLDDSACNLASINLLKFLEDGKFLESDYLQAITILIQAQEILVDLAGYPTPQIAENSHRFRPLGLGLCGLGAFVMRMGLSYDSKGARAWAARLCAVLTGQAYCVSSEISRLRGPFKEWKKNKKSFMGVLRRHAAAVKGLSKFHPATKGMPDDALVRSLWSKVLESATRHGVRNSQVTLMAPTGTIGLALDCDTTGIEPEFSLVKSKYLAGGGELRIESSSVRPGLLALGYAPEVVEKIIDHVRRHGRLSGAPGFRAERDGAVFATAVGEGSALSPEAHLQMMAAIQPYISGAISKTVNLPQSVSVDDIAAVYLKAYELKLKSVAVYRDGSKGVQPLKAQFTCVDCGDL